MSNWISAASKVIRDAKRTASQLTEVNGLTYEQNYETCCALEREKMKEIATMALQLQDDYAETVIKYGNGKCKAYWITVRPAPDVSWEQFYKTVVDYSKRKTLKQYTLVFEQKGTDPTTMGTGFHMHMVLTDTTWRSKADTLTYTKSTFAHVVPGGVGIDVVPCKTTKDVERELSYILNWTSSDGHKILTKEMDIAWRESLGLEPFYEVGCLSSPTGTKNSPGIPTTLADRQTPPAEVRGISVDLS